VAQTLPNVPYHDLLPQELRIIGSMHRGRRCPIGDPPGSEKTPFDCHFEIACEKLSTEVARNFGKIGNALLFADSSAACIIATTLRDCKAVTDIGLPLVRYSTIDR